MKTYYLRNDNQTLEDYCNNLRYEAELIQRDIEKLTVKRATLQEMSYRIANDFIEVK